jgi:hypothetical protein
MQSCLPLHQRVDIVAGRDRRRTLQLGPTRQRDDVALVVDVVVAGRPAQPVIYLKPPRETHAQRRE